MQHLGTGGTSQLRVVAGRAPVVRGLVDNRIAAGLSYASTDSNVLRIVGNQDYGPWPLPDVPGPLDRGYVPFGSVSRGIVVRGNAIESEGQLSVQADRDDGVSLVDVVVEDNIITGRTNPLPNDGGPIVISGNNTGFTVRNNMCDGAPCVTMGAHSIVGTVNQ